MSQCYCSLSIFCAVHQLCFQETEPSYAVQQIAETHKALGKQADTKSQVQGPYLPDKDPIPDVPIA